MLQLTGTTALAGVIANEILKGTQPFEANTKTNGAAPITSLGTQEPFWNEYRIGLHKREVPWAIHNRNLGAKHVKAGPGNRRRRHASLHVKTKRMSLQRTKTGFRHNGADYLANRTTRRIEERMGFRKRRTAAKRAERMNSTKRHHAWYNYLSGDNVVQKFRKGPNPGPFLVYKGYKQLALKCYLIPYLLILFIVLLYKL